MNTTFDGNDKNNNMGSFFFFLNETTACAIRSVKDFQSASID